MKKIIGLACVACLFASSATFAGTSNDIDTQELAQQLQADLALVNQDARKFSIESVRDQLTAERKYLSGGMLVSSVKQVRKSQLSSAPISQVAPR
ncbi:MAG: hypothetical protein JJU10_03185 [Idiomarina sp.]|nr:hypothetical protein [Idiomarina sp.]